MKTLRFKAAYSVRELWMPLDVEMRFEYGGEFDASVMLRRPSADEQELGHLAFDAFCTTLAKSRPDERVCDVFDEIARGEIVPPENDVVPFRSEYDGPDGTRLPNFPAFNFG